jgi:2-polyprenyl-3-methyl-5-hydroxy-6-metoxy-1,4-benzoquinol methylase
MIKQKLLRLTVEVVRRTNKLASVVMHYEPMTQGKAHSGKQYAATEWDYLGTIGETTRFGVVAAYCRDLAPSGTVQEMGCGDGILPNHLDRGRLSAYCGLDISSVAIDRARALEDDRTTFVCAPAGSYMPDRAFEVVVFNEVLEYFDDPAGVVKRYEPFVAPGGHLVVSSSPARSRRGRGASGEFRAPLRDDGVHQGLDASGASVEHLAEP